MNADRVIRRTFIAYLTTPGDTPDGSLLEDSRIKDIRKLADLAQDRCKWIYFNDLLIHIVAFLVARHALHTIQIKSYPYLIELSLCDGWSGARHAWH